MGLNCQKVKKTLSLFLFLILQVSVNADVSVRDASEISNETIDWMKIVADWQLTQSSWDSSVSWERGALHTGLMACYEATKDEKYLEKCREWSEKFNWQLGWNNSNHGDNMACAQTYLELYMLDERDPFRYADYKNQNDTFVNDPERFDCVHSGDNDQWWWCDALFMAPPALVRLSRAIDAPIYTTAMHTMWGDTQDCLYDTEEQLFYRDIGYLPPYNYNGEKVFWSRGNGWVIAGTARVLEYLPRDDEMRARYVTLLQEMGSKLADIQLEDGYWHSDLLSPDRYDNPETSGTGFFTFGIAWAINNGYLDEGEYWDNVAAGWDALRAAVQPNGLLGWVQPVGADPRTTTEYNTDVFGVGAYLLAGSEVYKYELAHDEGVIDCFEGYGSDAELQAVWSDGSVNGTASEIVLGDYGDNFMELTYNNDQQPYRSEVSCSFAPAKDFTANELYYLSILVRGDTDNYPERMYVSIVDSSQNFQEVVMGYTDVVRTERWQELGFALSDFDEIDLANVVSLTIGVGRSGVALPAGDGTIRIDNIRLQKKGCQQIPEDIVWDCSVDLLDFAEMAASWLDFYGVAVDPVDPGTDNLVGHWTLNETFADVSGNGHDGQPGNAVTFDSGQDGSSAFFNGADYASYVECSNSNNLDFENGLTISAWIKTDGLNDQWASVVTKGLSSWRLIRNGSSSSISFHFNSAGSGEYQANGTKDVLDGQWHHLMAVYGGSYVALYVDGELDGAAAAGPVNTSNDPVYIGSRVNNLNNRNWTGYIDDVRLYDTALNGNHLLYLAGKPGYVVITEPLASDLEQDGIVDMADLQLFIDKWLTETTWP